MNFKDVILVSHGQCMDGSTSATLFLKAGGKKKNIYFTVPGHDATDALVEDLTSAYPEVDILVVDASISLDLAERLDKRFANVIILDHHASAIPLNKFSWCEIDVKNTRSGAKMFYDFLMRVCTGQKLHDIRALNGLVLTVDDYDRWIKQIPACEDLVLLHEALQSDLFIERFLMNPVLEFTDREEYVIGLSKHRNATFVDRKKKEAVVVVREVAGHTLSIAIVEAGTQQSTLGNALCTDPVIGADVAVIVNSRSVSLRASQDCPVDLSEVAKLNFGGGHARAAGIGLGKLLGQDFVEMVFDKIKWTE